MNGGSNCLHEAGREGESECGRRRRRRRNGALELRGREAGAAAPGRALPVGRIGERVGIQVNLGATLRDEQRKSQPAPDPAETIAIQGRNHRFAEPSTAGSGRVRLARRDLEPQNPPAFAMQARSIR